MVIPAHIGIEHPNLVWLVAVGIATFAAGLGVNMYRSDDAADALQESPAGDEPSE
ncbi:hypothetical protein G9464_10200 [Halostella sp. JP-L12]|uniref:hypothetical protein n=1 Tax=Halostella TaxID=1843185 RepID=UPI0013CF34F6|nr:MULTISPECIES: hypothetical protein [Halostella]NHN47966.1 hypothetical protein [Halostella sp. JP-L12]